MKRAHSTAVKPAHPETNEVQPEEQKEPTAELNEPTTTGEDLESKKDGDNTDVASDFKRAKSLDPKEAPNEAPKEDPKEAPKEVPKEDPKEDPKDGAIVNEDSTVEETKEKNSEDK